VHAKVGQTDKATDLALLDPAAGASGAKWTDGLSASSVAPAAAQLRAMIPVRGARLAPAQAGVKGTAEAGGASSDAWAAWGAASQAGAKSAACAPVVVGAPVSAIRSFLTSAPA